MSQPIILWNAERRTNHAFDDAGISIHKTILAPPACPAPYTEPTNNLRIVPPLAYFCIRALTPYPDQLHELQSISYSKEVVRALVPSKVIPHGTDSDEQYTKLDVQSVDPRLWATLTQVMHPLPEEFSDYDLPLSDLHLPILQQVPSRDNFCFVTLLSLPGCNEVCDETIGVLRRLNTLAALDLRGTRIGSYGLTVLARSLSWSSDELQTKTGCWGLRIFRLHSCTNIDNKALPILSKFPLLSSIDLRFTRCTPRVVSKHLATAGFMPSSNRTLFHPAPLEVSLSTLENLLPQEPAHSRPHPIYSCPITSVYRLHISKLNHRERSYRQGYSLHMPLSSHDNRLTNPMYSDEDSDEGSDEDNGPAPEPTQNLQHSTASSIYASRGPSRGHRIRTAVVNSTATNKVQLDPLALARPPPPWSVLDAHGPPGRQQQSHNSQDMLASIGDTGLTKRHVAGMQDMVTSLAAKNKGRKVEHELASTSALPSSVSKMRNPFLKSRTSNSNRPGSMMRSVFAEQKAAATPVAIARSGMKIAGSMPKFCDAGALKTVTHNPTSAPCSNTAASKPLPSKLPSTSNPHPPETSIPMVQKLSAKQLRPITSYPVPPCPIEHLLLVPQLSVKRKKGIQTGLAIPRSTHKDESDEDEESIMGDDSEAPPKRARRDRSFTNTGKKGKRQEKAITHPITSASPPYASNPHHVQSIQKPTAKPLRPITSYPVPPCPIEHLLRVPQLSMKKKKGIQTELPFPKSREHRDDSDDGGEDGVCNNSKGNEKPPKKVGMNRGTGVTNTGKKGKQKVTGFDWNRWRRTTI